MFNLFITDSCLGHLSEHIGSENAASPTTTRRRSRSRDTREDYVDPVSSLRRVPAMPTAGAVRRLAGDWRRAGGYGAIAAARLIRQVGFPDSHPR